MKFSKAKPAVDGSLQVDIAVPAFGDKSHISIDRRHAIIRRQKVTDAAAHDGAPAAALRMAQVGDGGSSGSDIFAGRDR